MPPGTGEQPPPGRWDRVWGRFLGVLQAGLGTYAFVNEVTGQGERPYIIAAAVLLVSGAPATAVLAEALLRAGRRDR